jgi:hypothetical protein
VRLSKIFLISFVSFSSFSKQVDEFHAAAVIEKDMETRELIFDKQGMFKTTCTLSKSNVSKDNYSSEPIDSVDTIGFKTGGASCIFNQHLSYDFCALSSNNLSMQCTVQKSTDMDGWYVSLKVQPDYWLQSCKFVCVNL